MCAKPRDTGQVEGDNRQIGVPQPTTLAQPRLPDPSARQGARRLPRPGSRPGEPRFPPRCLIFMHFPVAPRAWIRLYSAFASSVSCTAFGKARAVRLGQRYRHTERCGQISGGVSAKQTVSSDSGRGNLFRVGPGAAWGQTSPQARRRRNGRTAEYDLYQSISSEQDANKKLDLLNQWKDKYATTGRSCFASSSTWLPTSS